MRAVLGPVTLQSKDTFSMCACWACAYTLCIVQDGTCAYVWSTSIGDLPVERDPEKSRVPGTAVPMGGMKTGYDNQVIPVGMPTVGCGLTGPPQQVSERARRLSLMGSMQTRRHLDRCYSSRDSAGPHSRFAHRCADFETIHRLGIRVCR